MFVCFGIHCLYGEKPIYFQIAEGEAIHTLREAAKQGNIQIAFSDSVVEGIVTNSISGTFYPEEALNIILKDTGLIIVQARYNGAFAVRLSSKDQASDPKSNISSYQLKENNSKIQNTDMNQNIQPPKKNLVSRFLSGLTSLIIVGNGITGYAQDSLSEDDVYLLSPFEVRSSGSAYRAESAAVATGIGTSVYKTPLSVSVITQELIENMGADEIRDIISFAAGVSGDRQNDLRATIRGFQSEVQRNSLSAPTYTSSGFNLERIEVVKGPASIFLGVTRPGGVLNYITRKPTYFNDGNVQVGLGTRDYKSAEFMFRGPINLGNTTKSRLAYLVAGRTLERDHWRDYTGLEEDVIHFALDFRPFDTVKLFGSFEHIDKDRRRGSFVTTSHEGLPESDADPSITLQQWVRDNFGPDEPPSTILVQEEMYPGGYRFNANGREAFDRQEADVFNWEAEWVPNQYIAVRHIGAYNEQTRDRFLVDNAFRARAGNILNDRWSWRPLITQQLNHKTEAVFFYSNDYFSNRLLVGFEHSKARERGTTVRSQRVVWNPRTEPFPVESSFVHLQANNDLVFPNLEGREWTSSDFFYFANQLDLFDERLNILGGGRWFEPGQRQERSKEGFTPMIGATYEIVEGISIYANYSESIRPRNRIDAFGLIVPSETGEGIEFGAKWNLEEKGFSGAISYFDTSLTNIARRDFVRENEVGISPIYVLSGEEKSEGVELEAQYSPNAQNQMAFSATYFFTAETVSNDNTPNQVGIRNWRTPDWMIRFLYQYKFAEGGSLEGLSIGAGVSGTGETHIHPSWQVDIYSDPYWKIDLFARYKTTINGRDVVFKLNVDNATDEFYLDYTFLPGDKMNVIGKVELPF